MERFALVDTPQGVFGMVARGSKLVATYLPQSRAATRRRIREAFPHAMEDRALLPTFQRELIAYYKGRRVRFRVAVDLSDHPPYRRAVLEACRKVPFGSTASYADLARATDNPSACRAVGSAMSSNPLPLVVPCHRILRSDGSPGGFASPRGIRQKLQMLRLEGIDTNGLRQRSRARWGSREARVA